MVDERKEAAARLAEAYRAFARAQRRAWSDRGADSTDRAAYSAARAELKAAELAAMQLTAGG